MKNVDDRVRQKKSIRDPKPIRQVRQTPRWKKLLCLTLVALLTFDLMPAHLLDGVFQIGIPAIVYSAAESDLTGYDDVNHTITIGSPAELVVYSQVYAAYDPNDANTKDHSNDVISIAFGSGNSTALMTGYIPIGSVTNPFKGTIKIATSSALNALRLDVPVFDYICDSASIIDIDTLKPTPVEIMVTSHDTKRPVLAYHVVHDGTHDWTNDTVHEWCVKKSIYIPTTQGENNHAFTTAGLIGQMDEDAAIVICVEDNVKQSGEGIDYPNANINGDSDIGYICHVMESGSHLTVKAAGGLNDAYTITTSSGNAGGVVGRMEEGSILTMQCNMNKTDAYITAAGSGNYAGGIVGKCDGGTIVLQDSPISIESEQGISQITPFYYVTDADAVRYRIANVITGVAGSGGIAGYYRPHFSAGTSSFDVLLFDTSSARVEGPGSVGGLFGVLENKTVANGLNADGGVITITDSQDQKTTVHARHTVTDCTEFGALAGLYQAYNLSDTLIVENIMTSSEITTAYSWYGGGIGQIKSYTPNQGNSAYVLFNNTDFTVSGGNTLDVSDSRSYGGLVANANNGFIDAKDVTANNGTGFAGGGLVGRVADGVVRLSGTSTISGSLSGGGYRKGQLVGYRDDSIVFAEQGWTYHRMSACTADDIGSWGEILRFAAESSTQDNGHILKSEKFGGEDEAVLIVDETAHTILISAQTVTGNENDGYITSIGNSTEYAKTALCFSIDADNAPAISFTPGNVGYSVIRNADITLTGSIDLGGTGLTGLTRDNDGATDPSVSAVKCVYAGHFDGGGHTIEMATGEAFGTRGGAVLTDHSANGNGRIYYHRYNGLFGILSSEISAGSQYTLKDVTFAGTMDLYAGSTMYAGSAAGLATMDLKAKNVHSATVFRHAGGGELCIGRLVGACAGGKERIRTIEVSGTSSADPSIFSGNVTGNNSNANSCIGGVIGSIQHDKNETAEWNFANVKLTGTISNNSSKEIQKIGGLIAVIKGYNWEADNHGGYVFRKRILTLDGVETDGFVIQGRVNTTGTAITSMGGLLGYSWLNTDVMISDIDINNHSRVSLINTNDKKGEFAGLVYEATGNWTVNDLDINSITIETTDGSGNAGKARSFGMLVNRGFSGGQTASNSSAIYMLLTAVDSFEIENVTFSNMPTPGANFDYDELVTYSAYYRGNHYYTVEGDDSDDYILGNGNGVISVKTDELRGLVMDGTNASKSYAAQTSLGAYPNPYSRYYYNLDTVTSDDASNLTTPETKLMSWALSVYAHESIKSNFASAFAGNVIEEESYDMTGYSWYPVDVDENVDGMTVNGSFTFANREFELSEKAKFDALSASECDRTSLYYSGAIAHTQHFLLQEGLLRNVRKTLYVGDVILAGNIGAVVKENNTAIYSGALVCGKVEGVAANDMAKVDMTDGSLSLDGIRIYNLCETIGSFATAASSYAPLLINKAGNYVSLVISEVSNTDAYNTGSDTIYAATELIGNIGYETAEGVNINFSRMKLDARGDDLISDSTLADAGSGKGNFNSMYHTYHSLFTCATLLHSISYASGSGVYNYTWATDWDVDNNGSADTVHNGNVTYGLELWDGSANGESQPDNHETMRNQYIGMEHCYSGSTVFTSPVSASASEPYSFADFLPYVYIKYDEDASAFQLEVNHSVIVLDGCGTYNDPYIFSTGTKLMTVADWINGGSFAGTQEICVPNGIANSDIKNTLWCGDDHKIYVSDGTIFKNKTLESDTITFENMRKYLAGAYYMIGEDSETEEAVTELVIEQGFIGFGNTATDAQRFRGVIDGNGKKIMNETGYPLICYSNGSVVRDLTLEVSGDVNLYGNNASFGDAVSLQTSSSVNGTKTTSTYTMSSGNDAYGAIIGRIMGGDNVIDRVELVLGKSDDKININICGTGYQAEVNSSNGVTSIKKYGNYAQLVPVGGYVGVVVNGGLVFRNMSRDNEYDNTIFQNVNFRAIANSAVDTDPMNDANNEWLYVNPIVGRVIGGYVINESVDHKYRPYEDGKRIFTGGSTDETENWADGKVTLENGKKHYSIADVDSTSTGGKLSVSSNRAINVPDGQSLFMLSLIVNSGMGSRQSVTNSTVGDQNGYYTAFYTVHHGDYSDVGCGKDQSSSSYSDYLTYASTDYYFSMNNSAYIPYIIKKYSEKVSDKYYAAIISYNTSTSTVSLSGNDTYVLPDGFRGIGRILRNGNNDNAVNDHNTLYVSSLNGNGRTISQNTCYRYYQKDTDIYDSYYNPCNTEAKSGLGLFNRAPGQGTYSNLKLKGSVKVDIIRSGSSTGDHIAYSKTNCMHNGNTYRHYVLSAGALFGQNSKTKTINAVALTNITIFSPKYAGGLIGNSVGSSTLTINNKITVNNSDDISYDSYAIKVNAGVIAGGMIGRMSGGTEKLILDYNDKSFILTSVVSDCAGGVTSDYYQYGVGGLVGVLRGGNSQSTIQNLSVGSNDAEMQTALGTVSCSNANLYAGGMFGILNRTNLKVTNCNIYNVQVESSFASGGMIGHWATSVINSDSKYTRNYCTENNLQAEITNVHISCTLSGLRPKIRSTGTDESFTSAGGFLASGKEDLFDVYFTDCSIKGYDISGKVAAGGIVGIWGDTSTTGNCQYDQHILILDNVEVSDCTVTATGTNNVVDSTIKAVRGCAGGIVGKLSNGSSVQYSCATTTGSSGNGIKNGVGNQPIANKVSTYGNYYIYGYNILTSDLSVTGNSGNAGNIVGANTYAQHNCIMIAGYSRQDTRQNPDMIPALVGAQYSYANVSSSDTYSLDTSGNIYGQRLIYDPTDEVNKEFPGYVVCADYNGQSLNDMTRQTVWASIGGSNTDNVTIGSPYVTSGGYVYIDSNNAQYLTGDGVTFDTSISYENSTIGSIMDDLVNHAVVGENVTVTPVTSQAKRYAYAYDSIEALRSGSTATLLEKLLLGEKYSSYNAELINAAGPVNDFPVLVVDDINATNTTEFLNNYIRFLTNTDFNYARNSIDSGSNATIDNAGEVYRIVIGTCTWNEAAGAFDYSASDPNLQHENGNFKMKSGSYDNAGNVGQFTLIDVQYLDPSDRTHTKVAYHLYVPVVVKKIMRYDFRATFLSGTTYLKQPYFSEWNDVTEGNSLVENIGNPVTLEMHYSYKKTLAEWQETFASGESLLYTYPKKMQVIDATGQGFPDDTRMVLVDPNCGSRIFYGTAGNVYEPGAKNYVNLNSFHVSADGTGDTFASVYMNDYFDVEVTAVANIGNYDKVLLANDVDETIANYILAGAIVRKGNDYYKYNEDGTGAYQITIDYKEGVWDTDAESENYGCICEDYYISFFMPETNTDFYHLEFYDPGTFNYPAYPSVVNTNYHSHLLTGKIFTNDFTITETNSIRKMSLSTENLNDTIGAHMTAEIGVEDSVRSTIYTYLGFESVKVYQSFLLTLNKQNSATEQFEGILAVPKVNLESFRINSEADISDSVSVIMDANHMEFRNGVDLSTRLKETCNPMSASYRQNVNISATVYLTYDDKDDLEEQFPLREASEEDDPDSVIGTKILGSSNLASGQAAAAYSKTVDEEWGSRGYLYFRTSISNAKLTLNSDDSDDQNGEYDQLGINANELDTDMEDYGYVPIKLRAFYDVSGVSNALNAGSMKLTVTVRRKDNYTDTGMLPIGEYITDLVIGDKNYTDSADYTSSVTTSSSVNATSYVYMINDPKDVLTFVNAGNTVYYELPMTFFVLTGVGSAFEEDNTPESKLYANYMIDLKAELYYDHDCTDSIEGTLDNDHVIWTNAKILTDIINSEEAGD